MRRTFPSTRGWLLPLIAAWLLASIPCASIGGNALMAAVAGGAADAAGASQPFDILEFRVDGVTAISRAEIEEAVYPHMGEGRTVADVEQARAAIEQAYQKRGYQVLVSPPPQDGAGGVIRLQVMETRIGRVRVVGARYHSPEELKSELPSLTPGIIPDLRQVEKEIAAANLPDREVTPVLRAGKAPGTIDVDLEVKDRFPLHGSVEVNNRQSEDTERLRTIATISYDNLWQLGHSVSFTYQVAPEQVSDSAVYSGSYLARFPAAPNFSLLAYGLRSKSNVASVGGSSVIGDGEIIGIRGIYILPSTPSYFQTITAGIDYKNFDETLDLDIDEIPTPITYYPFNLAYNGRVSGEESVTNLGGTVVFTARRFLNTSGSNRFEDKRVGANASFMHFQGGGDHTYTLPGDIVLFGRAEGFIGSGPLISNEQFAIGGQDTVRGFLEAIALGDFGTDGTLEVRSPSFARYLDDRISEWRLHAFADAGSVGIFDPPVDPPLNQKKRFALASVGFGSRVKLMDAVNGSVDLAFPVLLSGIPDSDTRNVLFRVWGEL